MSASGAGASAAPSSTGRPRGGSSGSAKAGGKAPRPRAPRKGGKRKSGGADAKYSGTKSKAKEMTPKDWETAMEAEAEAKSFVAENKRALVDAAMADLRRVADGLDDDAWMFEPTSELFDAGELHARSTRQHSHMSRTHLQQPAAGNR